MKRYRVLALALACLMDFTLFGPCFGGTSSTPPIPSGVDLKVSGSISSSGGTVSLPTNGMSTCLATISGTWSATLVVKAQAADGSWVTQNIYADPPGSSTVSSISYTGSTQTFKLACAAYSAVEVTATAYTSGTASVYLHSSMASAPVESVLIWDGTNTIGTLSHPMVASVGATNAAVVLLASTTDAVAHSVTSTAVTGLGQYAQMQILLSVTAAAAAAGDTLDVYVDSSPDGGTTWANAVHFTQVLGNGGAKSFTAVIDPGGAPGTSVIDVTSNASAGTVRPSMFADQLRVRYTIVDGGAHGQSFTFAVLAFGKSR